MNDTFFLHVASVVSQVCPFFVQFNSVTHFSQWHHTGYWEHLFCFVLLYFPIFTLPFPQTLIRSIFSKFFSFDVAEWKWSSLTYLQQEATQTYGASMCCSSLCNECLWESWVSWFLLWVCVRQTTRLLWSYK